MDRRTFTRLAATSVLCAPGLLSAHQARHVTIIGAGSVGLTAGYHIIWGGRVKRLSGFADVPLDLGGRVDS